MKTLMLITMLTFELVLFYYQLPKLIADILLMLKPVLKQMLISTLRVVMCRFCRSVVLHDTAYSAAQPCSACLHAESGCKAERGGAERCSTEMNSAEV
jgi:hypothetical protein